MFMHVMYLACGKHSANGSYYYISSHFIVKADPAFVRNLLFLPMGPHRSVPGRPAAIQASQRAVFTSQRPFLPQGHQPVCTLLDSLPRLAPLLALLGHSREP